MAKYYRQTEIEAVQWDGELTSITILFLPGEVIKTNKDYTVLLLDTLNGEVKVQIGDWLIKEPDGEIHRCSPELFVKVYRRVEE